MPRTTDVAIVGGGVIGCSIAYQLCKRGIRTTVFEKSRFGAAASGATAGVVGPLRHIDRWAKATGEMGLRSLDMFPGLSAELVDAGIDPEFRQTGVLKVARTPDQEKSLQDDLGWQEELGLGVGWLERDEVLDREPEVTPEVIGGIFSPREGYVRGERYVASLVQAASRLGGEFLEGEEVVSLVRDGGTVTGVKTASDTYNAGHTVLAAGPWTGVDGRWVDGRLPVLPAKGERILLRKSGFMPRCPVSGFDGYVIPQVDGNLLVAATRVEGRFDLEPTAAGVAEMIAAATALFPGLAEASFVGVRVGVRPASPDGEPLLGPVPGTQGLSLATGHDHVGIMLSPATGEMMAEYLATGDAGPLEPFSPARFDGADA